MGENPTLRQLLRWAARDVAAAESALAATRAERDRLVKLALGRGVQHRSIAEVAGITHGRVCQIGAGDRAARREGLDKPVSGEYWRS